MVTRVDWSIAEVEACVDDYLHMLALELNHQSYNKTEHAKRLMGRLDNRTRQSVEFKHCNISAVMVALGYPPIDGYKPRGNYQALLAKVVEGRLAQTQGVIDRAAAAAVDMPAVEMSVPSVDLAWVDPPRIGVTVPKADQLPRFSPARRDYFAQEARNRSLGRAGELFVVNLERMRLRAEGRSRLGERVEHVADTQGDGLGYDVLSFDADGRERLIEVKTTSFGQLTPFYVTRNEIARSEQDRSQYHLYRVFDFRNRPRVFGLQGTIAEHFELDPVSYLARLSA